MYPTAEVRWFLRGPVPPEVEAWFRRRGGRAEQEPPRADRYLFLPDTSGLNVKLREGRLEIKHRVGQPSVVRFHERVTGRVEQWRKWSFELAQTSSALRRAAFPASSWIMVQKERRLRTYRVEDGDRAVVTSAPEPPAAGCELELTSVRALRELWWTLAFEAFGDESTRREMLLLVARHVFSADEPPSLLAGNSRGYAAWLVVVTEEEV
jgi:hypothetical protein